MAHLLGSKSCIQSLRQDVLDLHTTISETITQSGVQAVNVKSWKYPDQLASDLNILELLSDYSYEPDETEDNQVTHIIMYELVIDRLVYLLHLATSFVSQTMEAAVPGNILGNSRSGSAASNSTVSTTSTRSHSMSTGLLVKKLWHKLSAFTKIFLETQEKNILISGNADALEEALEKVTLDYLEATQNRNAIDKSSDQGKSVVTSNGQLSLADTEGTGSESSIVPHLELLTTQKLTADSGANCASLSSVGCQTFDTLFATCNNCALFQRNIFAICDSINVVCQNYGLKAMNNKFLVTKDNECIETGNLSVQEIDRLCSELSKDLNGILKKCKDQNNKLESYSCETCELKTKVETLSEKLNNFDNMLSVEREKSQLEISKLNSEYMELKSTSEGNIAELSDKLARVMNAERDLKAQIDEINKEKEKFLLTTEKMKVENQLLEDKCCQLSSKLSDAESEIEQKYNQISDFESEITNLKIEIENNEQVLKKERVKNKISSNRDEELVSKQDVLVGRLEELDEQCESLKQEVSELEIERDEAKDDLIAAKKELAPLQKRVSEQNIFIKNLEEENALVSDQIKSYEDEVKTLNGEISNLKEKQDMLILFPDLTQIDSKPSSKAPHGLDPSNPRYIKYEMEQQILSNMMRIAKLDELNSSLRSSLSKIEGLVSKSDDDKQTNNTAKSNKTSISDGSVSLTYEQSKIKDPVPLINDLQMNYYRTESRDVLQSQSRSSKISERFSNAEHDHGGEVANDSLSYVERVKSAQKRANVSSNSIGAAKNVSSPLARPKSGRSVGAGGDRWTSSSTLKPMSGFVCSKCARPFKTNHELQMHSNFCF